MKPELRLLLDENIGLRVYQELRKQGYHVQSVLQNVEEPLTRRSLRWLLAVAK